MARDYLNRILGTTAYGALLLFAPMGVAAAQTAPAADTAEVESDPDEMDIIVTARKREETLLQVPVAVTVLTSKEITARGIGDLNKLTDFVPGLSINNQSSSRNDRSFQSLIIRGMTPTFAAQGTSVFIDGAPVSSGFVEGIDDVERVEVLKGPQNAYFGRQTFSGAVNIVTKNPGNSFKGTAQAMVGTDARHDVRLTLEGPIVSEILSMRVSGRLYGTQGQYRNNVDLALNPGASSRLGDQSTRSVNATLFFTPSSNLKVKLFGQYWRDDDGPGAMAKFTAKDFNCNAGLGTAKNYMCGTLPAFSEKRLAANIVIDPLFRRAILENSAGLLRPLYDNRGIDGGGVKRNAFHANLAIDYTLPGSEISISSLSAINQNHFTVLQDLDNEDTLGIPNPNMLPNTERHTNWLFLGEYQRDDWSQEVRMESGQNQPFRWMVGGSYNHTVSRVTSFGLYPFGIGNFGNGNPTVTDTKAGFISLAYEPVENVTISLEGRYQSDEVKSFIRPLRGAETAGPKATFNNFLPRAIVEFQVTPDVMLYASAARGVNQGVFNSQLLSEPAQRIAEVLAQTGAGVVVRPEKIDSFEAGVKARFWNGKGWLTATAYHAKWADQIITQSVTVPLFTTPGTKLITVSTNNGATDYSGIELEAALAPTRNLKLNATFGYAGSSLKDYVCNTCRTYTGTTVVTGNMMPKYSKWTGALGAEYSNELTGSLGWFARGDYVYRSGMYESEANLAKTPDVHRVNLRLGVQSSAVRVELFVLNALNNRAYTSVASDSNVLGTGRVIQAGMPVLRQFGVRAQHSF